VDSECGAKIVRVRIEYLDQNESFARYLPLSGRATRTLLESDGRRWWVVELDQSFGYQHLVKAPFQFRQIQVSEIVIGNRWQGHEVGESEPTSVHILLPLVDSATAGNTLRPDDFQAVAWGTCHAEAAT